MPQLTQQLEWHKLKTDNTKCWQGCGAAGIFCWELCWEHNMAQSFWETAKHHLRKLNTFTTVWIPWISSRMHREQSSIPIYLNHITLQMVLWVTLACAVPGDKKPMGLCSARLYQPLSGPKNLPHELPLIWHPLNFPLHTCPLHLLSLLVLFLASV